MALAAIFPRPYRTGEKKFRMNKQEADSDTSWRKTSRDGRKAV